MEYAMAPSGLMVHKREDWPCAVCRPDQNSEGHGFWLCAHCAHGMIFAVEAGVGEAREMLGDVTDALALLEVQTTQGRTPAN